MDKFYIYKYTSLLGQTCYAKSRGMPAERGSENNWRFRIIDKQEISENMFYHISINDLATMWNNGEFADAKPI